MLRRAHRNQFFGGIDADEVAANIPDFEQLGSQVLFAQVANIQPQVRSER